jgi:hypothetical protein
VLDTLLAKRRGGYRVLAKGWGKENKKGLKDTMANKAVKVHPS